MKINLFKIVTIPIGSGLNNSKMYIFADYFNFSTYICGL